MTDDFAIRDEGLTIENMVELSKMHFAAIDRMHKLTGDARLGQMKVKIVDTVALISPSTALALRAKLGGGAVTVNASGQAASQFGTVPPEIAGEFSATNQPQPSLADPANGSHFLSANPNETPAGATPASIAAHQPSAGDEAAKLAASFGQTAENATANLTGDGAKEGEESLESRTDFFLNNSPTEITKHYSEEQLRAFAVALGLTITPEHRTTQVAAIIKTHLKQLADKK